MGLGGKLSNAYGVVYIAVFIWWIVCLWVDEPGAPAEPEHVSPKPEYMLVEGAETSVEAGEVEAGVVEEHGDGSGGE